MAYQKFSEKLYNERAAASSPSKASKPPKLGHERVVNRAILDGLGDLGAPPAPDVRAPSFQYERLAPPAAGEPIFELPHRLRRGRVEERGGLLLHFCVECGAWGSFGYGVRVRAGHLGQWYCAEHRPR